MDIKRIINIDFRRCLKGLIKGKYFIILLSVMGGILGGILAFAGMDTENKYDAMATVYSIAYGSYDESEQGLTAIRTYSDIIKSYKVAERAALLLGDSTITKEIVYDAINVEPLVVEGTTYLYEEKSSVISIHAVNEDKNKAIRIVNAVADAFVLEVNGLSEVSSTQVLDYAYEAEISYNACKMQMFAIAGALLGGFFLGCVTILGRIVFSSKIVTVNDASLHGEFDVVGVIPRF